MYHNDWCRLVDELVIDLSSLSPENFSYVVMGPPVGRFRLDFCSCVVPGRERHRGRFTHRVSTAHEVGDRCFGASHKESSRPITGIQDV